MKSIAFLDIDGTLSMYDKTPQSALDAIAQARDNGHLVFINTGRPRSEIYGDLLHLQVDGWCLSAGTEIWVNHKRIFYQPLGAERAHMIQDHVKQLHFGYQMEGSRITYIDSLARKIFKDLYTEDKRQILWKHKYLFPSVSEMVEDDYKQVMKVEINTHSLLPKEIILRGLPDDLVWTTFSRRGGEITDKQYSKGTAIDFVSDYFGGQYRTLAFGDSENDETMLKTADISVGMGNSSLPVKQMVDYVTDSVQEDGMMNAFRYFDLL